MYFFYEMILGLFFIVFDIEYMVGGSFKIDIVSDVIGCVFIIHALYKMKEWSPCFKKSIRLCVFYAVSVIVRRIAVYYAGDFEYEYIILGISTIFYINMIYNIMEGLFVKNKTDGIQEQNNGIKASAITLCMAAGINYLSHIIGLDEIFEKYGMAGGETVVFSICNIVFCGATAFFALTLMQNKQELEK